MIMTASDALSYLPDAKILKNMFEDITVAKIITKTDLKYNYVFSSIFYANVLTS